METEVIFQENWSYTFYKQKDELYLSVVCGMSAVFDMTIKLNQHEIKKYQEKGQSFIIILASQIQYNPSAFLSRKI